MRGFARFLCAFPLISPFGTASPQGEALFLRAVLRRGGFCGGIPSRAADGHGHIDHLGLFSRAGGGHEHVRLVGRYIVLVRLKVIGTHQIVDELDGVLLLPVGRELDHKRGLFVTGDLGIILMMVLLFVVCLGIERHKKAQITAHQDQLGEEFLPDGERLAVGGEPAMQRFGTL